MLTLLVVFITGSLNMMGQTCPSGMISYWKLQEQAGPQFMDSHGPHNGFAPSSSPYATSGISGSAQLFNATGSTYITIPDDDDFDWGSNTSFSIEFWAKFTGGSAQNQVFIGRDETTNMMQWWIGATVTGKISWYLGSSDGSNGLITTDGSFNNGAWHHVVAVRDGTYNRNYLYVDGVLQNTGGTSVSLSGNLNSSSPISFGSLIFNGNPDYFFTGAMDEVAFYNRVLDANNDVIPHYNNMRLYQIGYCDGDDPYIFSTPNNEAMIGQLYRYDVDASGNSVPTYSLILGPDGMTINTVTGEITWTPTSFAQNGHVIVRATNDKGSDEQEFNIFIADAPSCRSSLIAYWDFDESAIPPFSDNIANYQMTGAGPASVQGLVGKGVMFDGINDSLNIHDIAEPDKIFFDWDDNRNFSIEVWVKTNATPDKTMVVVGRDQPDLSTQYWIGINTDGTAAFYLRDWPVDFTDQYLEGGNDGESILDGGWHHIVGAYSRTVRSMKLYVDGNEVASKSSIAFSNFGGNSNMTIGMLDTSPDRYWFQGILDEVAFYSEQLSAARVSDNYATGMAGIGACVYNHAPGILTVPDSTVEQGSSYSYQMIAEDIDPATTLTLSAVTKPDWLTFTPGATTAELSGIPTNDDVGTHTIKLRVFDGSIFVDQDFTIRVINLNDDPIISSSPTLEIDQGSFYTYTVIATDPDGDELEYSAPQKPASFTFDEDTHVLSGTPTNDDVGTVDITISVTDGTATVTQPFQITVNDINDAPEITSTPVYEIFQDEEYNYTLIANDPDGDDLTYEAVQFPAWMSFDGVAHRLSGSPGDFVGIVDIKLTVADAEFTVPQDFQVTVKNVNDVPVITSVAETEAMVNEAYLYQMTVTDGDGDALTFTAESKPDWLTFIPATTSAILSGTPDYADIGPTTVILKVSDGNGGDALDAFTIKVSPPVGIDNTINLVDRVYPIPAKDVVYFSFSEVGDYTLVLYDINGKVLKEVIESHTGQIKIDLSGISDQFLLYKVSTEDSYNVGKIVKE